jgi:pimeloyl-ACP methyl ester carboxylesterase
MFKYRGIKRMTDLHRLSTSHGSIVVEEAGDGDLPVLLIHGNSLSREVFRKQLGGALSRKYRLVAFDLPGHGDSSDARNASRTYTRPGLAEAATEVLGLLGLCKVVVVGWSLGGHIALEMASQCSGIKGLLVSGAPPVSRHNMAEGFIPAPHMKLAGQQHLDPSEIDAFGAAIFGAPIPVALRRAMERADGLARKTIFEAARSGAGIDQRWLVENLAVPLAVVNGSQDPFINLDYLEAPRYANLWEGRCHRLPGLKHAPFWEAPDVFDAILGRFIDDVAAR